MWFAAVAIAIEPAVRVGTCFSAPSMRSHIGLWGTRGDSVMMGALAALLYNDPRLQRCLNPYSDGVCH